MTRPVLLSAALLLAAGAACAAQGDDPDSRLDFQFTNVTQKHPAFRAPYTGPNSLQPSERAQETSDLTFFVGHRFGQRTELWINGEIDQGFGLSDTLGVAGFPSGEAYKVGQNAPYFRLPRAFVRHTVPLGGGTREVEAATNQFAGRATEDQLVLTVGKFSVVDVFDTNTYAHDPRADFLNWSVLDAGAFDYAADAWGYTVGGSLEWTTGAWTLRGGLFQLSAEPNGKVTGVHFGQRMLVAELEHRHEWQGHPGKLKLLAFQNRAAMARYDDAVALAQATGDLPDVSLVRRRQSRAGLALNAEQEIAKDLGVFARFGANDGTREAYEFTEINRSIAAGFALKGVAWSRPKDTFGVAAVVNGLSNAARRYFAAGGLGILIGDGRLNYASERIAEAYYSMPLGEHVTVALDLQRIVHPAYNADRGPVTVYGARLHADF